MTLFTAQENTQYPPLYFAGLVLFTFLAKEGDFGQTHDVRELNVGT